MLFAHGDGTHCDSPGTHIKCVTSFGYSLNPILKRFCIGNDGSLANACAAWPFGSDHRVTQIVRMCVCVCVRTRASTTYTSDNMPTVRKNINESARFALNHRHKSAWLFARSRGARACVIITRTMMITASTRQPHNRQHNPITASLNSTTLGRPRQPRGMHEYVYTYVLECYALHVLLLSPQITRYIFRRFVCVHLKNDRSIALVFGLNYNRRGCGRTEPIVCFRGGSVSITIIMCMLSSNSFASRALRAIDARVHTNVCDPIRTDSIVDR